MILAPAAAARAVERKPRASGDDPAPQARQPVGAA